MDFTVGYFKPPNYATVKSYGDRILKVEFTTPVDNLMEEVIPETNNPNVAQYDELRNFYLIYNQLNMSGSDSAHGVWVGTLRIWDEDNDCITLDPNLAQNYVRVAPDFKSLEIQYNLRSIPIGTNKIILNYSNNHLKGFEIDRNLMDFANPPRQVPTMTLDFEIVKSDTVAKAVDCIALSRREVVISYDRPIIVLPLYETGCLKINGVTALVHHVQRFGDEFNQLKFVLDVNSALPLNSADITIGSITDANGYSTEPKDFTKVPVISTPPRIKTLIQVDPPDEQSTSLLATWSKEMKYIPGAVSDGDVCNFKNYILKDSNKNIIPIKDLKYKISTNELMIVTQKLDSGIYFLHVEGVVDVLNEVMKAQDFSAKIEDRTIPKVIEVVFRKETDLSVNSFVVKFDDIMSTSGEHSATLANNYAIEKIDSTLPNIVVTKSMLDSKIATVPINKNKWIRFTLPSTVNILPQNPATAEIQHLLHIGYPLVKTIRYVEDLSKNIYPLCNTVGFTPYNILDISNGTKKIVSDNKLIFSYTGNNEIYSVSASDFSFTITKVDTSTNVVSPISADIIDWKTIAFTFPKNTFDGNVNQIAMAIIAAPLSNDIFGAPFKGNVVNTQTATNGLSPELKEVSLIKKVDDIVNEKFKSTLRFVFTKALLIFNKGDYKITLNNYPAPLVIKNFTPVNPVNNLAYIFDAEIDVPHSISLSDIFMISLVDSNYILSKDSSGNSLAPFEPKLVEKLIATNLNWDYQNGVDGLKGDTLEIVYNKPINPNSVITGWNGSNYYIAPTAITFSKNAKIFEMQIVGTNLGLVKFYPEQDPDVVTTNQFIPFAGGSYASVTNTAQAVITLVAENKLVIKFDPTTENAAINASSIAFVEYIASSNISDVDGKIYLYEAYSPTDVLS